MKAYERLLKYVTYRTPSNEESSASPSSSCQFSLAEALVQELNTLGLTDATVDEHCYVYAHLAATEGLEELPALGFIAHMDTVSDFCDHDTAPIITKNYDGKALALGTSGRSLSPEMFPHLTSLKGQTLITTDGSTILGADDKAGVAEIMTMLETILQNQIPHGPLCIAFTPDEEIGMGTAHFDTDAFAAAVAYTVDGDTEGGIEYENFNAAQAKISFRGVNVHPGSAKDIMVNAALVATDYLSQLPSGQTPRDTEGYEGFYHLCDMKGDVANAELTFIIRDFDPTSFQNRLDTLQEISDKLNHKWGADTVSLKIRHQYRNMREIIDQHPELITNAKLACDKVGIPPIVTPIRGGTDGASLSFMGIPCPNLGTGGHAFHGPFEHITIESMDKASAVLIELVKIFAGI